MGNIVSSVFLLLPSATFSNFLVLLLVFKNWAHACSSPTRGAFFPHCSPSIMEFYQDRYITYLFIYLMYICDLLKKIVRFISPSKNQFAPFIVPIWKSMFWANWMKECLSRSWSKLVGEMSQSSAVFCGLEACRHYWPYTGMQVTLWRDSFTYLTKPSRGSSWSRLWQ